ncbi:hypothetical protein [Massilia cavernae]|uniref:Uncharacterized protein n=1 Tax=Massilia cavernae TaxID=2320864 RepID=A0A418Y647_9BURK|nr:hypothetical protein [Massilia cavernae]RJG23025.1 hypothetical protein D3872_04905 [Massilia cavernae]
MWLVAIAWIYVVGLMALTETSFVAGVMTFLGYCALPLSILYYLTGTKRRKRKAELKARAAQAAAAIPDAANQAPGVAVTDCSSADGSGCDGGGTR